MTDWADDLLGPVPKVQIPTPTAGSDWADKALGPMPNAQQGPASNPDSPSWGHYLKHKVGLVADSIGAGLADVAGLPGDMGALIDKVLPDPYHTRGQLPAGSFADIIPSPPSSQQIKTATGLGSYVAPQGAGEEWQKAGLEGLGAGLIGTAFGMPLTTALRAGVGAGLGGKAGSYLGPWGEFAGSVLGGGIGGIGGVEKVAATLPEGSKVAPIISSLGAQSSNWQDAGQALRTAASDLSGQYSPLAQDNFLRSGRHPQTSSSLAPVTFPEIAALKAQELQQAIPTTYNSMASATEAIKDIINQKGSVSSAMNPDLPFYQKTLKATVDEPEKPEGVKKKDWQKPPVEDWEPKVAEFNDIRAAQSFIGDKLLKNPNDLDLNALHDAFNSPLQEIVDQHGPAAAKAWTEANLASDDARTYHRLVIDPILGSGGRAAPDAGTLVKNIVSRGTEDSSKLENVFDQMPGLRTEFLSALLNERPQLWRQLNRQSQEALAPDQGLRSQITDAVESDAKAKTAAQPTTQTAHAVFGLRGAETADALMRIASPIAHHILPAGAVPVVHGAAELLGLMGVNPANTLMAPINRGAMVGGALGAADVEQ